LGAGVVIIAVTREGKALSPYAGVNGAFIPVRWTYVSKVAYPVHAAIGGAWVEVIADNGGMITLCVEAIVVRARVAIVYLAQRLEYAIAR